MIRKLAASLLIAFLLVPLTHACTAFVVYRNGLALAGNNEDFWLTETKMWFVPKEGSRRGIPGKLGRVYSGFNFYPQGGMNEAGLFFDGFATAKNKIKNSTNLPYFDGKGNLVDHVMANCETVSEVVAVFEKYNLSFLANAMLMFSDQHGDSVIIEGDEMLRIKGDHQIVTNFYRSMTAPGECPCNRFNTAAKMLGQGDPVSIESCRDVLAATRQNVGAPTQYSNVYDLKKGLIYLYHFHNFEKVVCLNLEEELRRGAHEVDLPSLFPDNEQFDAFKEKRKQGIRAQTDARQSKDIDPASFRDFVGTYVFDADQAAKVTGTFSIRENRLFAGRAGDKTTREVFPEAEDLFFRIGDFGLETYRFQRNEENQVAHVTFKVFGRTYQGVKQQ